MSPRTSLPVALGFALGTILLSPMPPARACADEGSVTEKEHRRSRAHKGFVWSVAWSPGGKLVVSGDRQQVIAWDPNTGKEVWRLPAPPAVSALAFSPNGKILATVGWDGAIRLSEAATGKLLRSMRGSEDRLLAVAWSPDGKLLACGGDDGNVPLWDVTTGKMGRRTRCEHPRTDVSCVEELLEKLQPRELSPYLLREIRAVSVLERIGTAEARRVLERAAGGPAGQRLTLEARAALQQLPRPREE